MSAPGNYLADIGPSAPQRVRLHELGVEMSRAGAAVCDRTRDRAAFDAHRERAAIAAARRVRDQINALLGED